MSKVLIFNGSPRKKGNTATLVAEFTKTLQETDTEFEVFNLHQMEIKPCQFCNWCVNNNALSCVQTDDMNELYPKLLESEKIVLASPIYWFTISAQLKLFIDRLYALHGENGYAFKKKKVGYILVYGDSNSEGSGVNNAIGTLKDIANYMQNEIVGTVHGSAYKIGDAEKNKQLLNDVYELGKKFRS
ncbi:MAG: flavodoxin family protein [Candidatus Heimdallarchaeota archaeon]|nr:flavodoxin family protein [Candidatus Heimdallarchaeota archaeon]